MKRRPKHPLGAVPAKVRKTRMDWPDPDMVPTVALRRCEAAESLEEVRAIVGQFLPAVMVKVSGEHERIPVR